MTITRTVMPLKANVGEAIKQLSAVNQELIALTKQKMQNEGAIKNLKEARMALKKSRINQVNAIHSGNLLIPVEKKLVLDNMTKQIVLFENAIKGITGQIQLREDQLVESEIKLYRLINNYLKIAGIGITTLIPKTNQPAELPVFSDDIKKRMEGYKTAKQKQPEKKEGSKDA